jgi:hypothetical protein
MGRQTVSDEVKAAALADLAAGEQPAVVAQRYALNRDMVKKWKLRTVPGAVPAVTSNAVPATTAVVRRLTVEEHQQHIADLMYRLLSAKLEASERLAQHTATDWLDRQSAEGIAELGDYLDRTAAGILALLIRRGNPDSDALD